jgi:hypothetical protein
LVTAKEFTSEGSMPLALNWADRTLDELLRC